MTGLIKQGRARAVVTVLPGARSRRDPGVAADLPAPDPRLAVLETEIARLEAALETQRMDAERAIDAARKEGRAAAVAEDAHRTALIERGLAAARDAWNVRLDELDVLAVKLARTAVAKMFGDSADLGELVARTVAHHLGRLAADAVVAIRISAEDFPGDAIDALGTRLDVARSRLTIDADLDAGECRIDLKLGAMDVDPARQWAILDQALAAMERAE